ncbi:hypothetical protein AB1Y20_007499 [Prymnesium parvum]|uniref:Nucleotide-diphospho-sugar transferase domain-containing protein n=1 Tax=Prymnesium parvum TaxID=97485 RepID=A0AB34IXL4_PRYPA
MDTASDFFFIWTTSPRSFAPRLMRSIESVFRHHPSARLSVLSNSLPTNFFQELTHLGRDIEVERYDLRSMVTGTRAAVWLDFRRFWNKSSYFPNHEADLLRLLRLHQRGGVYLDTDLIFVRPLPVSRCPNAVGIESGGGGEPPPHLGEEAGKHSNRSTGLHGDAILCNALMSFEQGAALPKLLVDAFVSDYLPYPPGLTMPELYAMGYWGAMGPLLLSRSMRRLLEKENNEDGHGTSNLMVHRTCVYEREVFYPIRPSDIHSHFGPWNAVRDEPVSRTIAERSVAVHYWNALTKDIPITCGSLLHRLLDQNCYACSALPCVTEGHRPQLDSSSEETGLIQMAALARWAIAALAWAVLPSSAARIASTGHAVALTARPVALTARPVALTAHPVALAAHPVALTAHPVALTARPVAIARLTTSRRARPAAALAIAPQRIAIVGSGFAGLAAAFHLLNASASAGQPLAALHVFDPAEPGCGGASAVAAGLLHPFTPRGTEIWCGSDGFAATRQLIEAVEAHLNRSVSTTPGLLRLALDDEAAAALRAAADRGAAAGPLHQQWLPHAAGGRGGAYASAALSVCPREYMRGLWSLCEAMAPGRTAWHTTRVHSVREARLRAYDAIVLAAGAGSGEISELRGLPLRKCRGQNLVLANEGGLRTPLICGKYLVPIEDGTQLLGGATFEYDDDHRVHRPADADEAEAALRQPLGEMHPPALDAKLLGCQAGVRAFPPRSHLGYVPLTCRLHLDESSEHLGGTSTKPPKGERDTGESTPRLSVAAEVESDGPDLWLFTGLGSRGLIHHALLGRELAHAVLARDDTLLRDHTRRVKVSASPYTSIG